MKNGEIACEQCRSVGFKHKIKLPNGRVLLVCDACHESPATQQRIAEAEKEASAAPKPPSPRANMYATVSQVEAMTTLRRVQNGELPDRTLSKSPTPPGVPQGQESAPLAVSDEFYTARFAKPKLSPFARLKKKGSKASSYIVGQQGRKERLDAQAAKAKPLPTAPAKKKSGSFIVPTDTPATHAKPAKKGTFIDGSASHQQRTSNSQYQSLMSVQKRRESNAERESAAAQQPAEYKSLELAKAPQDTYNSAFLHK